MAEALARTVTQEARVQTPSAVSSAPAAKPISYGATLVGLATVVAIAFGFVIKNREFIIPSEGIGYRLGLYGGLIMVALLAYPAFKRTRLFGTGKQSASLFRLHMLLGIVGPVMIFFHTNFSLGALNSNIALFAMILVAGSGVIGRYIYTHVYAGLSGARYDVGSLLSQATQLMKGIEEDVGGSGGVVTATLSDFSRKVTLNSESFLPSMRLAIAMPFLVSAARKTLKKQVLKTVEANAPRKNWAKAEMREHYLAASKHVDEFVAAVSRASQLAFWERTFSYWHVLHVPLFFLLLVSGVIHVIAVHLY
jgi:hypothetical protein